MDTNNWVSGYLRGGLGNQLFIMAAVYGHSVHTKSYPVICSSHIFHTPHSKEHYENTVFARFNKIDQQKTKPTDVFYEPDDAATGTLLVLPVIKGWQVLVGYFQHEGYIEKYVDSFINMLQLPILSPIENTCFIHIRRADYLLPQYASIHHVDLSTYYPNAIAYIKELRPNVKFLIFSDDLEWCKKQSMFDNMELCNIQHEVTALATMSQCVVGGIAANSSFSWWGAFLNQSPNKIVTFPHKWFNKKISGHPAFNGAILL
jgi:hypothetical protein